MLPVTHHALHRSGVGHPSNGGQYNVPKRDLLASVQVALEKGELRIARELRAAGAERAGKHDDLVIALALACWKVRRLVKVNGFGKVRVILKGGARFSAPIPSIRH